MNLVSRYLDLVDERLRRYPAEREGQAHYNALRLEWPHLEHQVLGTERDCYGNDRSLPAFLDWVERPLAEEERAAAPGSGRPF